ncbi:hypothetical protein C1H76_5651 [Elsinoe australis]|uniref:Uncharacterized protein n=1 Tax=Elsinoe australis TaxID=40998 RepID=A0A4V6DTV5_9PEZI|nr:hypothetical protein C1H76_5651 [Elsinoe australis]
MKISYNTLLFILGTLAEAKKKKKSKPKGIAGSDTTTTTTTTSDFTTTTTNNHPATTAFGFGNISETYLASVINVETGAFDATTLGVSCPTTARVCPGGSMNITQSSSSITVRATASSSGVSVSQDYSCWRIGTYMAQCRETRMVAAANGTRYFSTAKMYGGATATVPLTLVEVTAGAEKLPVKTAAAGSNSGVARVGHIGSGVGGMWVFVTGAMGAVGALAFML